MNTLTAAALAAALAQECPGIWAWLVHLSHDSWSGSDLYLTDANEGVTFGGQFYTGLAFELDGLSDENPEVSITFDAVDQTIPIALVSLGLEPLDAALSIVYVPEDGGTVERQWGPVTLKMYSARGEKTQVSCTLSTAHLRDTACPAKRFTRSRAPGLFAPGTPYVGDRGITLTDSPVAGGKSNAVGEDLEGHSL